MNDAEGDERQAENRTEPYRIHTNHSTVDTGFLDQICIALNTNFILSKYAEKANLCLFLWKLYWLVVGHED